FKEKKGKDYKIVGLLAKRARGMMTDYVIKKRIDRPEGIKKFTGGGYCFTPGLSSENEWVFVR
ncbi:MAG: peroxide stress protein YaaA, partial [Alphaproteobacteria bacterium]|nr:peroxide stress protein YaaA [Alphaproteobacteria bacterium]